MVDEAATSAEVAAKVEEGVQGVDAKVADVVSSKVADMAAQLDARVGDLRKEVDAKLAATEHEEMRAQMQGRLDELHGRVAPLEEAGAKAAERVEEQMKATKEELASDFQGKVWQLLRQI